MFAMFGPYHIARINAAAINDNIVGIEVSATSNIYAWHKLLGTDSFQRVTLFSDASISQESNGEIRAKVHALLSKHQPDVVVVPGWASSWANSMLGWAMDNRVPAVLMSESQAIDFDRVWWREWIKRRVVGIYSAAIAGGRRHVQYLEQLGMPTERITTGYDVVDNEHFAAGARRARGRSEQLRRELGLPKTFAFVHVSTSEQWGLVVNEAAASGLPVIVSDRCGCAPELVETGINGFIVDPYDVESLAGAMCRIASSGCDRVAMGMRSQEIVSRWGPETFAKSLQRAVNIALSRPKPFAGPVDRTIIELLGRTCGSDC